MRFARVDDRFRRFMRALPVGSVDVASPLFGQRVKSARLRAFAETWSPRLGSVMALHESGEGKTTALAALARRGIEEARKAQDATHWATDALWLSGPELQRARRETRFGASCDLLDAALEAGVLFLDEIGSEGGDPSWLLELADERYRAGLPTLSTSGCTHKQLQALYGVAPLRRLVEPKGTLLDLFAEPRR